MAKKAKQNVRSSSTFCGRLGTLDWFITKKGLIRARRAGGGASRAKAGATPRPSVH